MIYAVIDTNVLVSAMITKNMDSPTVRVIDAIFDRRIIPVYTDEIICKYDEVLHRDRFHLNDGRIRKLLAAIMRGLYVIPHSTGMIIPDMDDLIFLETALEANDLGTYLVTGNQKHFPDLDFVVTPSEMVSLLEG